MKVLIGLSGGVDSSAAAALLKDEYEVAGVTLRLYDGDEMCSLITRDNINDAAAICKSIGIEHTVLDLRESFEKHVIDSFVSDYLSGLTPNPCINCNKYIKFGLMLEFAKQSGFDKIATGHYARVERSGDKYYLKKAADIKKDQTYVLYNLNQDILAHLFLPLGDYTKEQCREIAFKSGLLTAKKRDSQDICFVPSGNYGEFIEQRTSPYPEGRYIDKHGNILGKNRGVIHYTVGQRKGLGIALGKPAFVISKNAADNTVTLGQNEDLFCKRVYIKDINFICDGVCEGDKVQAKLRYSQKTADARFYPTENGAVLEFSTPQRAPAAGQSAVFYADEYCLGGGIIVVGE